MLATLVLKTTYQPSLWIISLISLWSKARSMVLQVFPREPASSMKAVALCSSGASMTRTTS